jgi:hypothetical protein
MKVIIKKRVMSTLVEVNLRKEVKYFIRIKGVSMEMTSDRREWKKKTSSADPI